MVILLTGGGTGGHIVPFEPILEALRSQFIQDKASLPEYVEPDHLEIHFIGMLTPQAEKMFKDHSIPATHIRAGKLRRYTSILNIFDLLFWLPVSILAAIIHVWRLMPDVVVSKGGYGSLPVVLAATFYRIPILLHESDAVPGNTNAFLFRFASAVTVGYDNVRLALPKWSYKVFVTGTPVRSSLTAIAKQEAKKRLHFPLDRPVLLVMGGSQGAKQINEVLLQVLPDLLTVASVLHLTGEDHFQAVSTVTKELLANSPNKQFYEAKPFMGSDMSLALSAADAIVSRAGATSLAEIARLRTPSLIIPLDGAANDHQRKNAQAFESVGAALVLDPTNLGTNIFKNNVMQLLQDQAVRAALQTNLVRLDFPQAPQHIAALVFQLARGLAPQPQKAHKP